MDPEMRADKLIELRLQIIKPYLNQATLPELGSVPCMMRGSECVKLGDHKDCWVSSAGYSMKTQGIFRVTPMPRNVKPAEPNSQGISYYGHVLIWGLTRRGKLVDITVFFSTYKPSGEAPFIDKPTQVRVNEVELGELMRLHRVSYDDVLKTFSTFSQRLLDSRQSAFESAQELHQMFTAQDDLLACRHS